MVNKTSIPKLSSIKWKNGMLAQNVEMFPVDHKGRDTTVDAVLKGAFQAGCYEVCLVGYDREGEEYIACTSKNAQRNAYMFERGKMLMMKVADE